MVDLNFQKANNQKTRNVLKQTKGVRLKKEENITQG